MDVSASLFPLQGVFCGMQREVKPEADYGWDLLSLSPLALSLLAVPVEGFALAPWLEDYSQIVVLSGLRLYITGFM